MKKWLKITLIVVGILSVVAVGALAMFTRNQAHELVTHPLEARRPMTQTPADYGLPYENVTVTTADGLKLVGWYLPTQNGAAIIAQHGYKGDRTDLLVTAELLHRHGYGVLLTTFRAHDQSEGELITLGKDEMQDFEAWYQYLLTRDDVDQAKIGLLGESMGGALAAKYAAQNPNIRALVVHSAFAQFSDTVEIAVHHFTGLPPFPFAPMILFWAEREAGVVISEIDTTVWIRDINPRPVFILQGGADDHISIDSGEVLYQAAGEPKEFWYEPEAAHHGFDLEPFLPDFERRVVAFFDEHLLGNTPQY
jgi:fermentation-respiration switch protein FrsA (DUF1100 family)